MQLLLTTGLSEVEIQFFNNYNSCPLMMFGCTKLLHIMFIETELFQGVNVIGPGKVIAEEEQIT